MAITVETTEGVTAKESLVSLVGILTLFTIILLVKAIRLPNLVPIKTIADATTISYSLKIINRSTT